MPPTKFHKARLLASVIYPSFQWRHRTAIGVNWFRSSTNWWGRNAFFCSQNNFPQDPHACIWAILQDQSKGSSPFDAWNQKGQIVTLRGSPYIPVNPCLSLHDVPEVALFDGSTAENLPQNSSLGDVKKKNVFQRTFGGDFQRGGFMWQKKLWTQQKIQEICINITLQNKLGKNLSFQSLWKRVRFQKKNEKKTSTPQSKTHPQKQRASCRLGIPLLCCSPFH